LDDTPLWLLFSLLAFLLAISAFFSASEAGLKAVNRYRLKHLAKKQRSARRLTKLLKRPERLRGAMLIGNSLARNFAVIVALYIALRLFGIGAGSVFGAGLVITFILLVVVELAPRTLANANPERVSLAASWVLKPLVRLFHPLVRLGNGMSRLLLRVCGVTPASRGTEIPEREEVRNSAPSGDDKDAASHQGMLIDLLDLDNVTVNDIMVPRPEIVGLDLENELDVLVDQVVAMRYTRVPVFCGDIDRVEGFLHMRKVNRLLRHGGDALTKEALKRFSKEPYFVPENTPLQVQLANFQKNRRRTALVVDEYGDVLGLVTLEDILEEIVGKFTTSRLERDEHIRYDGNGAFNIDGSATIREINKFTGWKLPTDGPKTLNGLALETLEEIPEGNVCFRSGIYHFETLSTSDKRVDRVRAWCDLAARPRDEEEEWD